MHELDAILGAWARCQALGESAVLATVVDVKGSAYRRPGARMLLTSDGNRVGTISGGCLEGDVTKKAWWWTESGHPAIRTYDTTSDEDAVWEFGLGCNGVVRVLLERLGDSASRQALEFLGHCRTERCYGAMATVIAASLDCGVQVGERLFVNAEENASGPLAHSEWLHLLKLECVAALQEGRSRLVQVDGPGLLEVFVELVAPPVPVFVFGAGHDAVPVVQLCKQMGWRVVVADGRPSFAKAQRFPEADEVVLTTAADPFAGIHIPAGSVAIVMNHSYPADREVLCGLLSRDMKYAGVLGPRARSIKMLDDLGVEAPPAFLHAPVGLDIGGDSPESIALSVVAEIQAVLAGRPGMMLRERRGPINGPAQPISVHRLSEAVSA